jgi:hypothetical protein
MAFAMAEFSGSNIMTNPLKSSLRDVDLHFGQVLPFVMELHVTHAFSLN